MNLNFLPKEDLPDPLRDSAILPFEKKYIQVRSSERRCPVALIVYFSATFPWAVESLNLETTLSLESATPCPSG